jgi:hypothetical protein
MMFSHATIAFPIMSASLMPAQYARVRSILLDLGHYGQ